MIRIQMLTGPDQGLQTTHTEQRLSFGRVAGNTVVIDSPQVSRQHGELVFAEGRWHLVNRSANGTTLNGRTVTADKPAPLKSGDVIGVGKLKLFSVNIAATDQPAAAEEEPDEKRPQKKKLSGRAKMWIGIGTYMGLMAIIIIIVAAVGRKKGVSKSIPPQLTDTQIIKDIREPMQRLSSEREASEHLADARNWMSRTATAPNAMYEAYRNYKLAMAYSGKSTLPDDQLQFDAVEKKLIETVTEKYRHTYAMVLNSQWNDAESNLRELLLIYPNTASKVFKNEQDLLNYVLSLKPKGRSFGT